MSLLKRSTERGISLLEMIVIIGAVGVMAYAFLRYTPNDVVTLETQAQTLANDIRYIQFLAMTQNQRYRVTFAATQYSLTVLPNTAVFWPSTDSSVAHLSQGIALTSSNLPNNYLSFDGQGVPYSTDTPSPGVVLSQNAVITLTRNNHTQTVTVIPGTGKVSVP